MTDKKTRIVSNLLSLMLGAVVGAGCYRVIDQMKENGGQKIELEVPAETDGGGEYLTSGKVMGCKLRRQN